MAIEGDNVIANFTGATVGHGVKIKSLSPPTLETTGEVPGSGGGGGTPGGSNTQLQRNNAGSFGGISGATSDGTTVTLTSPTIAKLANLTSNGVVKTSGGDGTLIVDTSTYLTSGGALGTPSSGTLTNATGLPVAGLTGLGTGVGTALGQAVSGSGGIALTTSPSLTTPTLGVASATSVALTGTAGAGFEEYPTQSSAPAAPATGFREYADSSGRKSWIRASDGFTRTWDATLTANRVYALPDATTTIAGLGVAQTWTAAQTLGSGLLVATSPKIVTSLLDTNGNTLLGVTATSSAVNSLTYANAATGGKPTWTATGSDADIGETHVLKGRGAFTIAGGTLTNTDDCVLSLTGTWNNSSNYMRGILMDITNTASQSLSPLIDLRVGGSTKFSVDRTGLLTAVSGLYSSGGSITLTNSSATFGFNNGRILGLPSDYSIQWNSASTGTVINGGDTGLRRFGAGILAADSGTPIGTTVANARHILAGRHQLAEQSADPSASDLTIAGSNTQDTAHIYMKNDKLVVAYNRSGTVNFLTIPLDGTTTTFTQSTTAP